MRRNDKVNTNSFGTLDVYVSLDWYLGMTTFGWKRVGLAVCLMALLLTAAFAECICTQDAHPEEHHADRHSHSESSYTDSRNNSVGDVHEDCCCQVDQRQLASASRFEGSATLHAIAAPAQLVVGIAPVANFDVPMSPPVWEEDLSYSSTLRSLLPSRAPPRL